MSDPTTSQTDYIDNEEYWSVDRIGAHVRIKQGGDEVYIPRSEADGLLAAIRQVSP